VSQAAGSAGAGPVDAHDGEGGLEVHVVRPDRGIDVELACAPGEVVALVGPPGAGATTVLRAVAGLDGRHDGLVRHAGAVWDRAGQQRTAPAARRIGWVVDAPLLLDHLDVVRNVALAVDGGTAATAGLHAAEGWLDALGLAELAHRRPRELSDGQAARVALARALASDPDVLLLDDPLAGLDDVTRADVRRTLAAVVRRFPGPVVISGADPLDPVALADRVVVLEDGLVVQDGDPRTLLRRPATRWIAEHVGVNLFRGTAAAGVVSILDADHELHVATDLRGPVLVRIRPQAVALHRGRPAGSPRNVWHGGLVSVDGFGGRMRVAITGRLPLVAEITPGANAELDLGRGGGIWVAVKATDVEVLPA
jgi:molybdate transport system ATP-binding protein